MSEYIVKESEPDENGYITRTEYKINDKNEKIKIISKIKRYKRFIHMSDTIKNRYKNWIKFGAAASENNNVTFVSDEDVFMEPPPYDSKTNKIIVTNNNMFDDMYDNLFLNQECEKDNEKDDEKDNKSPDKQFICKNCNGNHWSRVCPLLNHKETSDNIKNSLDNDVTIQITNLSKNITEYDLYDLFSQVGKIKHILIPKDYETHNSRGFGFIVFASAKDAENAINRFNNYGYDHLIIKLNIVNPK